MKVGTFPVSSLQPPLANEGSAVIGAHVKHYKIGIRGTVISKSKASKHKWDWPFYQSKDNTSSDINAQESFPLKIALADPASALIRILDPRNSTPETCSTVEALLADHYLSADSSGSLIPPLVEPVDATVYLFRRRTELEVEPEPDWADPTPDGYFKRLLSCHFKLKFMDNDTPIPGVKPLVMHLNEILGNNDQDEAKVITYDLKELGDVIMMERPRMQKHRAIDRAHATVKVLQDQQNKVAQKRKVHELPTVNTNLPANSFKIFKKQRQEERDGENQAPEDYDTTSGSDMDGDDEDWTL